MIADEYDTRLTFDSVVSSSDGNIPLTDPAYSEGISYDQDGDDAKEVHNNLSFSDGFTLQSGDQ